MEKSRKKVLITVRKAPHGTYYVQEALDVMFIMASYDMDLSVLFQDDGVFALKSNQNTKALGTKGFMASLGALVDWDVTNVYADTSSMQQRGMTEDMLVSIGEDEDSGETLYPRLLEMGETIELMENQDAILSF